MAAPVRKLLDRRSIIATSVGNLTSDVTMWHARGLELLTLPLWQPEISQKFQLLTFYSLIFILPYLLRRRRRQRRRKFFLSVLPTVAVNHWGKPRKLGITIIGNCANLEPLISYFESRLGQDFSHNPASYTMGTGSFPGVKRPGPRG
jgi:hypothetical protein